ncbi:MAG: hypothetical protein CMN85_10715 [Spongiibacteraceae bacterium]|nr:hypothetical protein [Spongiibacteraceae bacterium]|tara:strand:+ start:33802 stop:34335 length:534 start_codon:yes stop_codon:yes gene_type:complete
MLSFPSLSFKAKAVLAVVVLCAAFLGGWQARDWQCVAAVSDIRAEQAASLAEAHQEARWQERRYQDAADEAGKHLAVLRIERQRAKESIQVEQNAYVSTTDRFPIPAGWVFSHNYTACRVSGASESTCRANAPAFIARDDKALEAITNNYVECGDVERVRLGWEKFYGELKADSRPE